MIAGGVAAIVYGEPRLTQDIDLVVAMRPKDATQFAEQFPATLFYCPPIEVIAEEAARMAYGHFNVLHLETDARADVYLAGTDVLSQRGLATRRHVTLSGLSVPIAAPEHVILQKLRFRQQGASARHLRDVRAMLRVMGSAIDVAALEQEATVLGVAVQWREMVHLQD